MAIIMGRMIIVYFHISAYAKEDFDFRHKPGCNMRAQKKMCCTIFRNMYTSSGIIVVRFTAAFRMNGFPQLFMIIGCSRLCNPLRINFFFKRKGKQLYKHIFPLFLVVIAKISFVMSDIWRIWANEKSIHEPFDGIIFLHIKTPKSLRGLGFSLKLV